MDSTEVLVIGAGVVGLACARALAQAGLDVVVVEREARFGSGVSSRNSEVIHAGLYGAPGTLKAALCVRGRALLYDFCTRRHVAHRRCGKLVVATRGTDEAYLEHLHVQGRANGVDDLVLLSGRQAQALEPELACTAALHSPSSGIIDSHGLMTALLAEAEAHGALLACHGGLLEAEPMADGWQVTVADGASAGATPYRLQARWLVNAAGLDAQAVAAAMRGFPATAIPRRHLAKGHYFALATRAPFSRLIYPTPVDGGLGVHLTLDLAGQARFGPDVQWLDADAPLDYAVDARRQPAFEAEVRRYWPRLPAGAMAPATAGIRPKLSGPGEPAADFRIDGPAAHGCSGVVQLFGIESPGLTASLAIAEQVVNIVMARTGIVRA
jgi:L-2-hydroxyglutarate oxidase LhgO